MKKLIYLLPLVFLLGCKKDINLNKTLINVYGSAIDINLYEGNIDNLNYIVDIYNEYSKLSDHNFSYLNYTNVYDINNYKVGEYLEISKELYDLIYLSKKYYSLTNGNFNIAIGGASFKWKECINEKTYVNLTEYVTNNNYSIDIFDIELLEDNGYFIKKLDNVFIDLSGIAKGYANMLVLEYLHEQNINKYLINAGRSSILLGEKKNNEKFVAGLIDPINTNSNFMRIELKNTSLTTSGDYESYFIIDGKKYHHLLSKDLDCKEYYHSISIVADNPALSDALSTALFCINIDEALKMCKDLGVEAVFYLYDGSIIKTEGFVYEKA